MLLALARQLEGEAHDPVAAGLGEDRLLHRHLHVGSGEEPAADFGVLALVVLAHDVEIDVAGLAVLERRLDAGEQLDGTQIDVLVETAPDRDEEAPERDVIGHAWKAHRAQEDRVELARS